LKKGNIHEVGKHGRLALAFSREGDKTVLRDSFATIPMHAFPPFYPDDTGCAHLYIVNPTSGLVGGDRIESEITLEENAHAFITSPTATKVYRSTGEYSESTVDISLKRKAVLEYFPRHVIPFAGSMYRQNTRISMEAGSMLFFLEGFTTGRTVRHEHLGFREYISSTEIAYCGTPVVTDRFILDPEMEDYGALGFLESYTVSAALYIIFDEPSLVKGLVSLIEGRLSVREDISGGVSALPSNGVGARLLGNNVYSLEKTAFDIFSVSREELLGMGSTPTWERLMQ
jgi:urease accessory protein